ncbi:MAG: HAD-IC family P-type ATPase [archaeon]|nr:HAD-IC family P-type ATPase [archaeon]
MELKGLSSAEVQERSAAGKRNSKEARVSRGYFEILKNNLVTPFNIILFILGAALLYFNEPLSAFAATAVIIFNVTISTAQEFKAKRRLDKIALLMRPKVKAIRDGVETIIDRSEIVLDDIIHLEAGDQAQVDGKIIEEKSFEIDESLLTGESSTRRKHVDDDMLSGAYVVAGEGWIKVTSVGDDTFSAKMLKSAQKFTKKSTPLQNETAALTEVLTIIAGVFLVIMVVKGLITGVSIEAALKNAVIVLDIVPIALFLLITLTYMIAAVRMADSGVLLQNSNSVESMSHVDTVCMDKTGTITTNNLVFEGIDYLGNNPAETDEIIRRFVSVTGSRNRTILAMESKFGTVETELVDEIQFSSDRKFSAVRFKTSEGYRTVFMGAWPFLNKYVKDGVDVSSILSDLSSKGLRSVVLFDGGSAEIHVNEEITVPPLKVLAVISIMDEVRPDCKEIINEFTSNGMDIKVISGDDPDTVDAIFKIAEIPGERKVISGDQLSKMDDEEYRKTVLETNIFGRMRPEQKEKVVETLRNEGRYVAMIGDGINDVRPIKKAQVGIAVQSGSGAARSVADMVLVNDDFKALPKAIVEGKRTVNGMRDILRLYISRNFTMAFLVLILMLIIGFTPMMPIQNSAYALITVSASAFLLTLWAKPSDNNEMVLPQVVRYVIPTSITLTVFGLGIYTLIHYLVISDPTETILYIESFTDKLGISYGELMKLICLDPKDLLSHEDAAEIAARNVMFAFLMVAGISQLILLFPPTKKLAIDKGYRLDFKPICLAALLFLGVYAFFNYPEVCLLIAQTLPLPDMVWPFIIIAFLAWYVVTWFILRRSKDGFLERYFDAWIRKQSMKNFEKESAKELEDE